MSLQALVIVAGRLLLAMLFILAGVAKLVGPGPFRAHMDAVGVPRILLPAVIVLETGAGLALAVGWRTSVGAGVLAAFCLLTAGLFHRDVADKAERTLLVKDLALAGALAMIAAGAAG